METELAGDKAALQQMGARLKHPRNSGCLLSACSVAEAKHFTAPHRDVSLFLQARLPSHWVFPAIARLLLPALKCVPHPWLFASCAGSFLPLLQCWHTDRTDQLQQPPSQQRSAGLCGSPDERDHPRGGFLSMQTTRGGPGRTAKL